MARRNTPARRLDGILALAARRLDGMLALAARRLDWTTEWLNCHEATYIVVKGFPFFCIFLVALSLNRPTGPIQSLSLFVGL